MRQALKAQVEINCRRFLVLGLNKVFSLIQAPVLQPLAWCRSKGLLKIAFEPGKATTGELGEFFDRHIKMIVADHKTLQVDLVGFGEIK